MTDPTDGSDMARRVRHREIRAQVAAEETEAAEAEAVENAAALDVSLHLRISRTLDAELRQRAAAEHIPTSALVRRLLTQAIHEPRTGEFTKADIERIAREVAREEVRHR